MLGGLAGSGAILEWNWGEVKRGLAVTVLFGALVSILPCSAVAWAVTNQVDQYSASPGGEVAPLRAHVREQGRTLSRKMEDISSVGSRLDLAQSRVDAAQARVKDIGSQTKKAAREVSRQKQRVAGSRAKYEQRARAAYKGEGIGNFTSLLGSLFGSGTRGGSGAQAVRAILEGQQSVEEYQNDQQYLSNSIRQLRQQNAAYEAAFKKRKSQSEQLSRREKELEASIASIKSSRARAIGRIQTLKASERERILAEKPATGYYGVSPVREQRIARHDIAARRVKSISKKRYKRLYKKAAKKYGFAKDWYVLAAVGWVESRDGRNMGPSSAGAMGPMQFLPSTWKSAGVDGNGDGVANIMDPRDAIPAAAAYLKDGGAPRDWYAALYTYNHADWYVREVLGVAEGYRQLAKDNKVRPYTRIQPRNPKKSG